MELDALADAIDRLAGASPQATADPESLLALERQLARLDAVVARAVAAFDASRAWAPDGARTAVSWLATRGRLARHDAKRQLRLGRAARHLPEFAQAWTSGEISGAHVDVVAPLLRDATHDALSRDEHMLAVQSRSLSHTAFVRATAYWAQLADPDGTEERAEERRARRDVQLSESFGGTWLGRLTLDPISGSIVAAELGRLEQVLFEADWADARQRLGREPRTDDLSRTGGQRRADALVEMATRSRTMPSDGRRPAPLFSVLVGYETLRGRVSELASGTVLAPGSLARWIDRADIERAVFAPGRRVEVSVRARLFTGATRRAIELRDRACTHPCCEQPAPSCEVDHVVPFASGGETTQENGRLLCGFHNRLRNDRPPPAAAAT